jgi:hypothetical protein
MKKILLVLFALFITLSCAKAQNDSLVINFKDGHKEKIALTQLKRMSFPHVNGVEQQENSNLFSIPALIVKDNIPNPASDFTSFNFELNTPGKVTISIFNNLGELVRTLQNEYCSKGSNSIIWNCLDENGKAVKSGSYYYEIKFHGQTVANKMIIIN